MDTTNLTGHFIIAMPSLLDENFDRTVTYICEHDENGTFGIVINRETDVILQEVLAQMNIGMGNNPPQKQSIFLGGPVQQERGFILHKPIGNWGSSLKVNDDITLTTSRDILEAIAGDKGPEQTMIALGYAGWDAGQLEYELAANSWLSCPGDEQIIFKTPASERWQAAADLIGVNLQLLSSDTGHA